MQIKITELGLSAEILKEKQSVRATFKLPVQVIKIMSVAAAQLGIKQKTLIDQLMDDREILAHIAQQAKTLEPAEAADERRQKTFVLSRKSLLALERVAGEYGLPRDLLIEISINRLLPILDAEQKKLENRKKVLAELEQHQQAGIHLYKKASQRLGERDPVVQDLKQLLDLGAIKISRTRQLVENGSMMEDL